MTTRDALYRAIVADPDDDTARLAYADWLEENGRPEEAEFARVGCHLEAAAPDHPEYAEWEARDGELKLWLAAHLPGPRLKFPAGLEVEGGGNWWNYTRRGFPRFLVYEGGGRSAALKPMRALAKALERAFTQLPTRWLVLRWVTAAQLAGLLRQPAAERLDTLTVLADDGDVARVIASSRLPNLRGLSLGRVFGDAGAAALAAAPNLGRMEWLDIPATDLGPAGVRALAAADWFPNLRSLEFDYGELPAESFEELCRAGPFPRLHTLGLPQNAFPLAAWEAFARSESFPALSRLRLNNSELTGGRAAALFRAAWLRPAYLDLGGCSIGADGAVALAAAPWVGSLRWLRLWANGLGPRGVAAIARCRRLAGLKHLDLSLNAVGATGLRALAANPALRGLIGLDLTASDEHDRGLTPAHYQEFLARLDLPELRFLSLARRPLGGKVTKLLAGEKFRSLRRLDLNGCKLTDAAAAELVALPALQNLVELNLGDNRLGDGLRPLADRRNLPRLSWCRVSGNRVDDALRNRLCRRAVPGLA